MKKYKYWVHWDSSDSWDDVFMFFMILYGAPIIGIVISILIVG